MLNKERINHPHRQLEAGPELWVAETTASVDVDVSTIQVPL